MGKVDEDGFGQLRDRPRPVDGSRTAIQDNRHRGRDWIRHPVRPPDLDALAPDVAAFLHNASSALCDLAPLTAAHVASASNDDLVALKHPLSDAYAARHGPPAACLRSAPEEAALLGIEGDKVWLGLGDDAAFSTRLAWLNAQLVDEGEWRTGSVGTQDAQGDRIIFPPPESVPGQLAQLRALLASGAEDRPAVFVAATALVMLTNCHPFRDGNGRVGRVLFNAVLRRGGMSRSVYVPFAELAARSQGGYEISLRQAELHGQWEPFLRFVVTMLHVHRRLATRSAGGAWR